MRSIYTLWLTMTVFFCSYGQTDTTKTSPKLSWSAFADVYYVFDAANPSSHQRPAFLYNHNRHNEVNLNLGFVKAAYVSDKVRANLALMAGTYAQYNLASEQGLLKNVFEANIGVKLLNKHSLWFDAGIFTSHIGFESAISKDGWTLTRSLSAENSPYYLSGAKLTYTSKNEEWSFVGLALNGWQRIQRIPGNNSPAFGTQIQYKPNGNLVLNYSTFMGNDKPDSTRQTRYYQNLYAIWQVSHKWGLIAGVDYGLEQKLKGSKEYNYWYVPTAIVRYTFTDKWAMAARAEYYYDKEGVIITTGTPSGFQTAGYSLNVDYKIEKNLIMRVEARMFDSKDKIFTEGTSMSNQNYFVASSIAISL